MRKAIFAGTFDPFHKGHEWIVNRGAKLFDELIVIVSDNNLKSKKPEDERVRIIERCNFTENVKVVSGGKTRGVYTVHEAREMGAEYLLRGVRSGSDINYEVSANEINTNINDKITTVFLNPPAHLCNVSSTMIRSLIGYTGWEFEIRKYVPRAIYNYLLSKHNGFLNLWMNTTRTLPVFHSNKDMMDIYRKIIEHYSEDTRYYHNLIHLSDCFNALSETVNSNDVRLTMAIFFHDYIMTGDAPENDSASAFAHECKSMCSPKFLRYVKEIIMATAHHFEREKHNTGVTRHEIMMDIDLIGFANSWDEFVKQNEDIRREYPKVTDEKFREGQKKMFAKILGYSSIYQTPRFRKRYESKARKNIERYIQRRL